MVQTSELGLSTLFILFFFIFYAFASCGCLLMANQRNKELLSGELRNALISGCGSKSLGVILLLCPFNRIMVVGFPLGPIAHLATGPCVH